MEIEIRVRVNAIDEARKVIDALALASTTTAAGLVQIDLPPADEKPAPKARRAPRAAEKHGTAASRLGWSDQPKPMHGIDDQDARKEAAPTPQAVGPAKINGEDTEALDDDDDDALRAQAAFEAKRVQRTFGIGGMRAAIRKVTGENILQVDDVPVVHLPALLTALQGM